MKEVAMLFYFCLFTYQRYFLSKNSFSFKAMQKFSMLKKYISKTFTVSLVLVVSRGINRAYN